MREGSPQSSAAGISSLTLQQISWVSCAVCQWPDAGVVWEFWGWKGSEGWNLALMTAGRMKIFPQILPYGRAKVPTVLQGCAPGLAEEQRGSEVGEQFGQNSAMTVGPLISGSSPSPGRASHGLHGPTSSPAPPFAFPGKCLTPGSSPSGWTEAC